MKGKFPNRLAEAMEAVGIGPTELQRLSGISKQDIFRRADQTRRLTPEMAETLAPHLKTTPAHLLMLNETEKTTVPLEGRIVGGGVIDVSTAQDEPGLEYEVELSVRIPDATVAYQVVGESMMPVYRPDTVIICRAHTQDIDRHIGKELAVGTRDHGRMLKTVHPGSKPGRYDLESFNASTIRDAELAWVARIAAIIPADEWQIIERRVRTETAKRERLKKPSQRQRG